MVRMETYVLPVTFPDLDTAKRDMAPFVQALRAAGLHTEVVGENLEAQDDSGREDPGPTTRELRVHATSATQAREQVTTVMDGQFPPGTVLLGEPTRL